MIYSFLRRRGETGRRAGLKILWTNHPCRFESDRRHQTKKQPCKTTVRLFFYICRATACSQERAYIKNKTRSVVARLLLSAVGGMKYRRAPIECRRWHEIPPNRDIICFLPLAKLYMRLLDYSVKLLCFYHSISNAYMSLNILRRIGRRFDFFA